MTESFKALGRFERDRLSACLAEIGATRARLRDAQRVPGGHGVYRLRQDLVAALEAYGTALTATGTALPRQLRTELELQRGIGHHH